MATFANLANSTNIFFIFSSFSGQTLDPSDYLLYSVHIYSISNGYLWLRLLGFGLRVFVYCNMDFGVCTQSTNVSGLGIEID